MAVDTYLKLDGIPGEATDSRHTGEIEVLSWSWGATNDAAPGWAGGRSGRAEAGDLVVVHPYDRASPLLAAAVALGRHVPSAVLSLRHAGAGGPDHLTVTLTDVTVTSVQVTGSTDGANEQVTLAYREVSIRYRPQAADGSLGAAVSFAWDTRSGEVG